MEKTSENNVHIDLELHIRKPLAIGAMSQAEIDCELAKGINSMDGGITYTLEEVDEMLSKEFGIE